MTDPDSRAEPDDALILRLVREHFSADFRHQLLCQRQVGDANEDAPTFAIQQFALGIWQAARRTLPQGYAAGIEAAAEVCEELVGGPAVREAAIVLAHRIRARAALRTIGETE